MQMQMFHLIQMEMRMQIQFARNAFKCKCKCFGYTFANAIELISNVLALYYINLFYLEKKTT